MIFCRPFQVGAFCRSFLLFMFQFCLCYAVLSVSWRLVVTCWERADLFLALLCFCHFSNLCCGSGMVLDCIDSWSLSFSLLWYLGTLWMSDFVSLSDICDKIYDIIWATAWDFQQFEILTSVDSVEHSQPPVKLRNSKWCSVSSLTIIEYSSD